MQTREVEMGENNPILYLSVNERANADSSHCLPALPGLQAAEAKSVGKGKAEQAGLWKILVTDC